ncbi:MAG: glutathione S-transferase family protein [Gemmobacter sp.]
MPYTLYGWRQTGSMAIEAALAEGGIAHDVIAIDRAANETRTPAFTAINPRQQLPVLVLPDGTVVTEGPAILSHLADAHPATGLAPPPGSGPRARHDRWMGFFHANVYEAMLREIAPRRYTDDPDGAAGVARAATACVRRHFRLFDAQIGAGPFVFGDGLTMLDIYVWMLCYWVDADWLRDECPAVRRLKHAADARPALAATAARHFG